MTLAPTTRTWLTRSQRAVARMRRLNADQQHFATRRLQACSLGMAEVVEEIDAKFAENARRFRRLAEAHQAMMAELWAPVRRISA